MPTTLNGLKVLDLSRVISGPSAAQNLGDMGADVIKVERTGPGDESRYMGATLRDKDGNPTAAESSTLVAMNRNKRSITVDIAKPEGQEVIRKLALWADVLLENFKTGDLKRYGLDYPTLSGLNPRLIYCSITGFGQTGPYSHLPGYDLLFQGMSGLMSIVGIPDGEPGGGPQRVGYPLVDMTSGLFAVIGIMGAVYHRDHVSNKGQHVDIALLDTQVAVMAQQSLNYRIGGELPRRNGLVSKIVVPYQPFECADGTLLLAVANDIQFVRLADALGHPEWKTDPRFARNADRVKNRVDLAPQLDAILKAKPVAYWNNLLNKANVPNGPIYDFAQVATDPQVQHRQLFTEMPHPVSGTTPITASPLRFSESPVTYRLPPPTQGQHTDEVLNLIGYSDTEITQLKAQKAV